MYVRAATVQVQPENMQELIDLFKDTMAPVIIVPLLSLGFGFGAGGGGGKGKDKDNQEGEGSGGGTGGGGGVKPVAVIIIGKDGVRVEPIQGPPSGLEKLGAAIGSAMDKRGHKSEKE